MIRPSLFLEGGMPAIFVDERRGAPKAPVRRTARFEADEEMEMLARNPHRIDGQMLAVRVVAYLRTKSDAIRTQLEVSAMEGWDEEEGWRGRAERALAITDRTIGRVRWMLREMRRSEGGAGASEVSGEDGALGAVD